MKKLKFIWRDCKTQLTLKEVEELKKSKTQTSVVLVDYRNKKETVTGQIVSTRWLSDNAFYFTFLFEIGGVKQGLKIKQNVEKPEQRYLEEMDPVFLERLLNYGNVFEDGTVYDCSFLVFLNNILAGLLGLYIYTIFVK